MKNIQTFQRAKNVVRGFIAAAVLSLVATSAAANYEALRIYPEHVGIFVEDGKQQFIAIGITSNGVGENITDKVEWISSDPNLVTIDENGMATVLSTSGQVRITCSYPKTGSGKAIVPVIPLLLRNE